MLALVMALTLCATAWAVDLSYTDDDAGGKTIDVGDYETLKQVMLDINANTIGTALTINITADIDCGSDSDSSWTPGMATWNITIIGNGKTISNLQGMLLKHAKRSVSIKGLILDNVTVSGDETVEDDKNDVWNGAFLGDASCSEGVVLENCKVTNSTIKSSKFAGGLIGYGGSDGGYTITIKGCTVENCIIKGYGSTGGLIGHAMGSNGVTIIVSDTVVRNNTIVATDSNKAGAVFGTVGTGSSNGASISVVTGDNSVSSAGTAITTVYGRRGDVGTLTLTGGSYDKQPLKDEDSWASVDSSIPEATVTNADGTPTSFNYGDSYVQSAAKNATAGQTINVTKGNLALTDIPAGVTVAAKESAVVRIGDTEITANSNPNGYVVPCTVTFDADNGTKATTVSVPYNTAVAAPTNPTKDGYVFEHWCLSTDDTHAAYNFEAPVTSDITLKAHWTVQSSGGTHHFNRPQPTTVTKAESPKTFDAGIAVYGVMAISSVLGMGYMGKKKV